MAPGVSCFHRLSAFGADITFTDRIRAGGAEALAHAPPAAKCEWKREEKPHPP